MKPGVHLTFLSGPEDGNELKVRLPSFFGRLPENEVPLPYDALASRKHARLSSDGTSFFLEDLGSRNGTYLLTGEPLRGPTRVAAGDLFRVGGVWFRLVGRFDVS